MDGLLKLTVYIPDSHLEVVKAALFAAGAGRVGDYDCCAWQVLGDGQFRPLAGANPHIGQVGELEHVPEWRVELVLPAARAKDVVMALKYTHPYEVPAYDLVRLLDI